MVILLQDMDLFTAKEPRETVCGNGPAGNGAILDETTVVLKQSLRDACVCQTLQDAKNFLHVSTPGSARRLRINIVLPGKIVRSAVYG